MKTITSLGLLFLTCLSALAQDTIFYKNFNDLDILHSPTAKIYPMPNVHQRIVSNPDSQYIDGTPALAFNIGLIQGTRKDTPSFYRPTIYQFDLNQVPAYNYITFSFQVKAKGLVVTPNYISFPALHPSFHTTFSYNDSLTSEIYSKSYQVNSLTLYVLRAYYYNEVFYKVNPTNPDLATVTSLHLSSSGVPYGFDAFDLDPWPLEHYELVLPNKTLKIERDDLIPTILQDFCAGSNYPSDCMLKATWKAVVPSLGEYDSDEDFLIDNVLVLGSDSPIIASLETSVMESNNVTVRKAYTLLGTEIEHYESYEGLAILVMSDGSRTKVCKR
jgi:hypothetical protein